LDIRRVVFDKQDVVRKIDCVCHFT
jgi:hypothetical protein